MAGKKGAKKAVGKSRKGGGPKFIVKVEYVQKENGAYAPKRETVFLSEEGES